MQPWWNIYQVKWSEETACEPNSDEEQPNPALVPIDFAFYNRLRKLEKIAIILQYQFAYLSTLGGAYHLCNQPKVALNIAKRQELLGHYLGSNQIIIRALVFQAINYRLLGFLHRSEKLFHRIRSDYKHSLSEESEKFVDACEGWARRNIAITNNRNA